MLFAAQIITRCIFALISLILTSIVKVVFNV